MRLALRRLWDAYERQLQRQPLATQMTTSALLWGAGDVIAQQIEALERRRETNASAAPPPGDTPASLQQQQQQQWSGQHAGACGAAQRGSDVAGTGGSAADSGGCLDPGRAALTALFGGSVVGPLGHAWYLWLDRSAAARLRPGSVQLIAAKVVADTSIMGPFYVAAFFAWGCAVIDRGGVADFVSKMRVDFVPTFAAEVAVWPLLQTINFWRVPVKHQLLVVNGITMLDAAFMSWVRNQEDWFGSALKRMGY